MRKLLFFSVSYTPSGYIEFRVKVSLQCLWKQVHGALVTYLSLTRQNTHRKWIYYLQVGYKG
jgi:hypothetical protein